jgi:hypothetical protein
MEEQNRLIDELNRYVVKVEEREGQLRSKFDQKTR